MFGCLWCPVAHPTGIEMACRANLWSKLYQYKIESLFQMTFYYKPVFPNLWVQLVKEHSVQLMGKLVQTLVLCSKGSKGEKWENGARSLAIATTAVRPWQTNSQFSSCYCPCCLVGGYWLGGCRQQVKNILDANGFLQYKRHNSHTIQIHRYICVML